MKYKNMTCITKTFYDIEFKPGEEHDVPGFINAVGMFRTDICDVPERGKKVEAKATEQAVEVVDTPAEEETKPKRTRKSKESED